MKILLYCCQAYSFSILRPIELAALAKGYEVVWYVIHDLMGKFPYKNTSTSINTYKSVDLFAPDVIFVPGNEVPYFFRGVKVQIFHGFAGEKKGHFRIRDYFDLYLTQGPYFTRQFQEKAKEYQNFEVIETGWSKMDPLFNGAIETTAITQKYGLNGSGKTILYAPTFSPKLTSANVMLNELMLLTEQNQQLVTKVLVKFHPLMDAPTMDLYKSTFAQSSLVSVVTEDDLSALLLVSDLMISDTSSAIYEFLLCDKPVVTLNTSNPDAFWPDYDQAADVIPSALNLLKSSTPYSNSVADEYHPYKDGKSSERMLAAVEDYIERNGIPVLRDIPFWRKLKYFKAKYIKGM